MQKQSFAHPVLSMHRIVFISIGILSVLLLASCGGGGSTDPNATAQSNDEGTKTIQAVSGSTAVPGTWTGRAPKMEVINGITVPPEPAPAINNATLAGVDVNKNGVRDDVERKLAVLATKKSDFDKSIAYINAYQKIFTLPLPTTRALALLIIREQYCALNGIGDLPRGLKASKLLADNANRKQRLQQFDDMVNGYFASEVDCH